jgi:hypothetical protein
MICTRSWGIETQNTQLAHRHILKQLRIQLAHRSIFNQLSTSTNRRRIETQHNKLIHRQASSHLLAPQHILRLQIRNPTNEYDTHRATREVKAYKEPIAIQISNSKHSSPSLSTNLGPNAGGKIVMLLKIPKYPVYLVYRRPLIRDSKKLPCNLPNKKPTQSVQCLYISTAKHNQIAYMPPRDSSKVYTQNTNECGIHVHNKTSSKQKQKYHSGKNTTNRQDPTTVNYANGKSYKIPAEQGTPPLPPLYLPNYKVVYQKLRNENSTLPQNLSKLVVALQENPQTRTSQTSRFPHSHSY